MDAPPGLRFTERLAGFVSTSVLGDDRAPDALIEPGQTDLFKAAAADGRARDSTAQFVVTIEADDLPALLDQPSAPARLSGMVLAPAVHPQPLTVADGRFELFVEAPEASDTWQMRYHMRLLAPDGGEWTFEGTKLIRVDSRPWRDTTTLFTTIRDSDGVAIARGVLRISPADLARQLRTMTITNVASRRERLRWLGRFVRLFAVSLRTVYGGVLDEPGEFRRAYRALERITRPLELPEPQRWWRVGDAWVEQADQPAGASGMLTRYAAGRRGPVILAPGFAMNTGAFVLTTIEQSLAEHLAAHEFDVWLFDPRFSPQLPSSAAPSTIDDLAQDDWPSAIAQVLAVTGDQSVQVVAHCFSSVAVQMAILWGDPRLAGRVRSLVASQATVHPVMAWFNRLRADLKLADLLARAGLQHFHPDEAPDAGDYTLDVALRGNPLLRGERCTSPMCRWITWWFGPIIRHTQLDQSTHRSLHGAFGVTDLEPMRHISRIVRTGHAVDRTGADVYLPHVERLELPILFLAGADNRMFLPASSLRTQQWLIEATEQRNLERGGGPDPHETYQREVLPGYAHLDCIVGRTAHVDVFPSISAHLLRT